MPDSYREASFGLGAGKLRTIFTIVLPSAVPGILAGVILAIGRIIGETAALLYTSGTVAQIPDLMGSGRTLALHMYVLSSEGLHMNEASATAVVILIFVLIITACQVCWLNECERIRRNERDDKAFNRGHEPALRHVSCVKGYQYAHPEKEITAFIGPSGCGKSTLLKSLNR